MTVPQDFPVEIALIFLVIVNIALIQWNMKLTVMRTLLRCFGFFVLTMVLLRNGMVPTARPDFIVNSSGRFVWGAIQIAWWIFAAALISAIARTYYKVNGKLQQQRFRLDLIEALLYLIAAIAIISDVLNIPLRGVLATSGAVAIVLGLALQSTLADLFSGLVINASSPFTVGDSIKIDADTEGTVIEITWRATHVAKSNRDLIVIPNSVIAKAKVINRSIPEGAHATVARFQTEAGVRPSSVTRALDLAIQSCVEIADTPRPVITTTTVTWEYSSYEITFYLKASRSESDALNTFYDAAHRHLESISILAKLTKRQVSIDPKNEKTIESRVISGIDVFGLITEEERQKLAAALAVVEYQSGAQILAVGEIPDGITIVAYGVASAVSDNDGPEPEIVRFGPWEYFGESGPIAGAAMNVAIVAKTHVIAYELPRAAISALIQKHPEIAHILAAKVARRLRTGKSIMRTDETSNAAHRSLVEWVMNCMRSIHNIKN